MPKGYEAKYEAYNRERGLHCETAFVGWLPFGKHCGIIEQKARWLFGKCNVEGCPGKSRCGKQCQKTKEHFASASTDGVPN